jgi:glutathione-regulated potassium-efflux system protein KefB
MTAKAIVLIPLGRAFGMCNASASIRLAATMSQGGEFAFVLFGLATREGILERGLTETLTLAVTVSLLLTPFLVVFAERLTRRIESREEPDYDVPSGEHSDILIAGFGRVGQIVGRLLRIVDTPFTALEADAGQVSLIRRYGGEVHFGDASRLDLLRAAGAEHAKIIVIATSRMDTSLHIAENVVKNFPNLTIIARARNRRHAHKLMDLGVKHIFRDTLLSSVEMSKSVLLQTGMADEEAQDVADMFLESDERLLAEQHAIHDSEEKLIQTAKDTVAELETLFRSDRRK